MDRYLLDTNMLLGLVRGAEWAKTTVETYRLSNQENLVFTTIVCRGEILALAEKRGWGEPKRKNLTRVLNEFPTIGIEKDAVVKAYAKLSAWSEGKAVENFPDPPKPARKMGQNDLWIAAVARVSQAVVVTTDKDFDEMSGKVIQRIWVDQRV